jgi:hypothetical protein
MQSPAAPSKAATDSAAERDPVSEFKPIVEKFIAAYNEVYKEAAGELAMVKEVSVIPEGAKFDVKKSESVVSPYTGELHAEGILKLEGLGTCVGTYTFLFAFQDGKWVPQGGGFSGQTVVGTPVKDVFKVTPEAMARALAKAGL